MCERFLPPTNTNQHDRITKTSNTSNITHVSKVIGFRVRIGLTRTRQILEVHQSVVRSSIARLYLHHALSGIMVTRALDPDTGPLSRRRGDQIGRGVVPSYFVLQGTPGIAALSVQTPLPGRSVRWFSRLFRVFEFSRSVRTRRRRCYDQWDVDWLE